MDAQTALTTIAGVAAVVSIALQIVKPALGADEAAVKRFAPLGSGVLGIALGVAGALCFGNPPVEGAVTGYLGGAAASGLYDQVASRFGLTEKAPPA